MLNEHFKHLMHGDDCRVVPAKLGMNKGEHVTTFFANQAANIIDNG